MKLLYYYRFLKIIIILSAIVLFILLYFHKEYKIKETLSLYTNTNIERYKSTYHYYKTIAKAINKSLIDTTDTLKILKKLNGADEKELNILRQQLKNYLDQNYLDLKDINFKQFHFHLKNNISFLRMHRPEKYGDDLSDIRYGVKLVNKYLLPIDGFEEGRIISAFRFIYPIVDDEKHHLGSVEISVGAEGIIKSMHDYLEQDIHFIIKKSIVNKLLWKDELKKHYKPSIESSLYYQEILHNYDDKHENHSIFKDTELFEEKLNSNKPFSLYSDKQIVSFIPIKNIQNNYVAFFVIYSNSVELNDMMHIYFLFNMIILLIVLILFYILHKDYKYRLFSIETNRTLSLRVSQEVQKNKEQIESNYFTLFNTIPQSAAIVDPRTTLFVDINKAAIQKYGYTKEEALKMSIYDLDLTSKKRIQKFFKQYQQTKINNFETLHIMKNGVVINVIVNISKIFIAKRAHYLLITTDITRIRSVQKEMKEHRDTLQTIVYILNELISNKNFNNAVENSMMEIVNTLDVDRVYIFQNYTKDNKLYCSQKFEYAKENISNEIDNIKLQNISYEKSGLDRWRKLFLEDKYINTLVKDLSGYEREILELQGIKSILIMPICDKDNFWGFIGFDNCSDERIWNKLEKDVLKSFCHSFIVAYKKEMFADELQEQVTTQLSFLREKDKQLLQQAKLAQMGDMISMIAHQWRQPLNTISAVGINLSLLSDMDALSNEKVQEDTLFLQNQCQKMSSTIDTFINFVKPSKESKTFTLLHTIDSVLEIMGSQLKNHNIKVIINNVDEELIVGYEDLLEQVVINILSNARDAFNELDIDDKNIKINIYRINNIPTISIEDNAGGIPIEIRDKIFNPYFTTKEQGSGIGIGLYMSMDIMKKMFNGDLKYIAIKNGSKFLLHCGGG